MTAGSGRSPRLIEGNFDGSEGSEAEGSSDGQFGLVVEAFDGSGGDGAFGAEPVEEELAVKFDGVIVVGLEQGRVPPRVQANEALAAALEQRALREIYVSVTRARYRLVVANSAGSAVSGLLQDAPRAGLLEQSRSSD